MIFTPLKAFASQHETRTLINRLQYYPWIIFIIAVASYIFLYSPYGLDNGDGGFILGLSHQLYLGQRLYDEIIYVRPPVTPILHSFVFYPPFSFAPVFIDRAFFFLQVATYSALPALIAGSYFKWGISFTASIGLIAFLFSAHSFPPMAWHTVDGLFFSALSLYFLLPLSNRIGSRYVYISIVSSLLAAGSKQPYAIIPVIVIFMTFYSGRSVTINLIYKLSITVVCTLILVYMTYGADYLSRALSAISGQSRLSDLYEAGILDYLRDIKILGRDNLALITSCFFLLCYIELANFRKCQSFFAILAITGILGYLYLFYIKITQWDNPTYFFDTIFILTFGYAAIKAIKLRTEVWGFIVALHTVAWASSISWGYLTTSLFLTPSVITIGHFVWMGKYDRTASRILFILIASSFYNVFYIAHSFIYNLDGAVILRDAKYGLTDVNPAFRYIYATQHQRETYLELRSIADKIESTNFVVLPNFPFARLFTGSGVSPIGVDWALNAEIGKFYPEVLLRLNNVMYAVVYKTPFPSIEEKVNSVQT